MKIKINTLEELDEWVILCENANIPIPENIVLEVSDKFQESMNIMYPTLTEKYNIKKCVMYIVTLGYKFKLKIV